ncbi:MAG: Eco57I restriction-modification methylase domain-containing protein [Bacteroidales bacterium]|nr:Eco57I restriction-modification methylase domain-containing protein [Bacteroidales bacterium]
MLNHDYNPDVLNCLANLSNDEVFTPPVLANRMIDLLPEELFHNPKTTFLDPFCKSGVFLREIVKRLDVGLQEIIPDRQERIDHILHKQVFGIAITELTSYLSRRSVYCSKTADSEYSVSHFDKPEGNIKYHALHHTWENGKCKYCGASQSVYDRGDDAEQYAYQFIHTDNPKTLFNMKFDVIIGNPPYQLSDGGNSASDAAMPIYNKFVEQAKKLSPKYLIMIIPSKWMVGGRGLQSFKNLMKDDLRIKEIFDFEDSSECFNGVHLDGGVCYFLWDKNHNNKVKYTYKPKNADCLTIERYLKSDYSDIVIRDYRRESIIRKVLCGERFKEIVSARKPFNIGTDLFNNPERYMGFNLNDMFFKGSVKIFGVKGNKGGSKRIEGFINENVVTKNKNWVGKYKLLISKAYSSDAINPPQLIVSEPNSICTETFLVIGPFENKEECFNCLRYTNTNFFKVLLFFGRGTMQVSQDVFRFVPMQDFSHPWTDEMLYKKYGLTEEEIAFIESMIKPME